MSYNRIYIFGGTASGKTNLAKKISKKLKIPTYSTDNLIYKRKWDEKYSDKEKNRRVLKLAKKKRWIVEGVHRKSWINPILSKADLIIILLLARYKLIIRLLKRELQERISRKNKSTIKDLLTLIKYSWIYKNDSFIYHKNSAREFNKEMVILKSNNQINQFLQTLQ